MAYEDYKCFKVEINHGVAFVTIDHPPINLLDLEMMKEMNRIGNTNHTQKELNSKLKQV